MTERVVVINRSEGSRHGSSCQLEGLSAAQPRFDPSQGVYLQCYRGRRPSQPTPPRMQYSHQVPKVCPVHGEVGGDEIDSGYEYAKGQYVVIDPSELDSLRSESDKAINIDTFVSPHIIEATYYSGKNYYLTPDGAPGQKPYRLFHQALLDQEFIAVATVVMHGKEQLVLLRPQDNLLVMTILNYESEVKNISSFNDEVDQSADYTAEELKLTKTLMQATQSQDFVFGKYTNKYTERLTRLIEAKIAGEEIVAASSEEPTSVISLMDALKASVERAQQASPKSSTTARKSKSPAKMATSSKQRKSTAKRKKKSG